MSDSYKKYLDKAKKRVKDDHDVKARQEKELTELYDHYNLKYNQGGKVGSGKRFEELKDKLSHQKGVTDPGALAASIGNKKYGVEKMQSMAHKHMAVGGVVNSSSANTATSVQPLLKEQYAGKDKKEKKYHDLNVNSNSESPDVYAHFDKGTPKVGMGDVMTADQPRVQGPGLQQGYGDAESNSLAQQMKSSNRNLAIANPKAHFSNTTPEDVARTKAQMDMGSAATVGNLAGIPSAKAESLANDLGEEALYDIGSSNKYKGGAVRENDGQVKESQQKTYQAKEYPGKGGYSSAGPESRMSKGGPVYPKGEFKDEDFSEKGLRTIVPHYDEGTPAVSDAQQGFLDSIKKAFNPPAPSATPVPQTDLDKKYEKIRQDQQADRSKTASDMQNYDEGTSNVSPPIDKDKAQQASDSFKNAFAKGGEVDPYKRFMKLFNGVVDVPKLKNPLAAVHAPVEKKYPLNIPRADHIKIPKRLKSISDFRGYDEGTSNVTPPNLDPQKLQNAQQGLRDAFHFDAGTPSVPPQQAAPANQTMDLGDVPITPSTPYPGEEEQAQQTVDNSTQGQVQQMIDEHNQGQQVLQKIDQALGKDAPAGGYPQLDARQLGGMTLNKDEALAENPNEDKKLEDTYKSEEDKAEHEADKAKDQSEDDKKEIKKIDQQSPSERLKAAQEAQNKNILFNQLGKATDIMGASMGHFRPQNGEIYDENIKNAGLPVQQIEQQIAMDKYDPNSATSKTFRQYLAKFGGKDVTDLGNISAADAEAIAPMAFKQFEAQQGQQARAFEIQERNKERLEQAKYLADQRAIAAKQHSDDLRFLAAEKAERDATTKEEKAAATQEKQQASVARDADQALYGFRQPPDVKQARMDFYNAQKGINTIAAFEKVPGGLDSMDPNMVGNVRNEVQKIAQSGAPTEGGINKFDPNTFSGQLASLWQKFSNHPTGANAAAFLKEYKGYLGQMQDTAGPLINSYNQSILKNKKRLMNDDDYNDRLNSEYVAPYLKYNKAGSASPQGQGQQGKTVVKKGYNPTTDQTQLIYSDGTKEIVDGRHNKNGR